MPERTSSQRTTPDPHVRKMKIEAEGDIWKGLTIPKIRLTGRWLERAGFKPGHHFHVTCVALGVIEFALATQQADVRDNATLIKTV